MDSRLIFLHRERSVLSDGGTEKGRPTVALVDHGPCRRPGTRKIRAPRRLRAGPSLLGEVAKPMLPGKASKRVTCVPVPKPTQVGEWRTLRRSSELWLRNSANCPRNFGRRGALDGVGPRRLRLFGAAENRPRRLFTKNTGLC